MQHACATHLRGWLSICFAFVCVVCTRARAINMEIASLTLAWLACLLILIINTYLLIHSTVERRTAAQAANRTNTCVPHDDGYDFSRNAVCSMCYACNVYKCRKASYRYYLYVLYNFPLICPLCSSGFSKTVLYTQFGYSLWQRKSI